MDIAEVLKRAKTPERIVDICLDADLGAEHRGLEQQLREANRQGADVAELRKIGGKIRDVEGRMKAAAVPFRICGMSAYQRDEWLEAHPPREGKQETFNPITGEAALVATCCADPRMTVEQAQELRGVLGGDWDRLAKAAWDASTEGSSVPFSFAASAALRLPSEK